MSHNLFPIFLDIRGRHVLVYGAGAVAARRVETLNQFGPRVTVIAPEFSPAFDGLDCARIHGMFDPAAMPMADCVLACTSDPAVNRQIAALCHDRGIWVNSASNQRDCDFHFPAVAVREPLVVGLNAGGRDHSLVRRAAAKIRALLESME